MSKPRVELAALRELLEGGKATKEVQLSFEQAAAACDEPGTVLQEHWLRQRMVRLEVIRTASLERIASDLERIAEALEMLADKHGSGSYR